MLTELDAAPLWVVAFFREDFVGIIDHNEEAVSGTAFAGTLGNDHSRSLEDVVDFA